MFSLLKNHPLKKSTKAKPYANMVFINGKLLAIHNLMLNRAA
jgi:hypothetical protein